MAPAVAARIPTAPRPAPLAVGAGFRARRCQNVQQGAGTVLVTGSFHTVGDVMEVLGFQPV